MKGLTYPILQSDKHLIFCKQAVELEASSVLLGRSQIARAAVEKSRKAE